MITIDQLTARTIATIRTVVAASGFVYAGGVLQVGTATAPVTSVIIGNASNPAAVTIPGGSLEVFALVADQALLNDLAVFGNTVLGDDADADTVTLTARIASSIEPSADGSFDLGHPDRQWQDGFFSGDVTADAFVGDLLGNAATATALETARTLWGQSFDGTANVLGALTAVTDITASGTGAFATRLTSPLIGTTTGLDVVFDRAGVPQLTLASLSATFAGAAVVTSTLTQNGTSASLVQGASGTLTVGSNTSTETQLRVSGATGTLRQLIYTTAGSFRWNIYAATNAESGSNAGTDMRIAAYSDAGAFIDNVLTITRAAAGTVTIGSGRGVTMTGILRNAGTETQLGSTTGNGVIRVISQNTGTSALRFMRGTTADSGRRWSVGVDTATESGGNAGTAFQLVAADDAGTTIDVPIGIVRAAAGTMTLTRPINHTGATATVANVTSGTASLTVGGTAGSGAMDITLRAAAGQDRAIYWRSGTLARWRLYVTATAESGGNAGSGLIWQAFDDAGSLIDNWLTVSRAAGGVVTLTRSITQTAQSSLLAQGTSGNAFVAVGSGTQTGLADLRLDTSALNYARVMFRRASVDRWAWYMDNSAESGANAGSQISLAAHTDAGAFIDNVIRINRPAGDTIAFSATRTVTTGALTASGLVTANLGLTVTGGALGVNAAFAHFIGRNANGATNVLALNNLDTTAATLHQGALLWNFSTTAPATVNAASITVAKIQEWTSTASTQDSVMTLRIVIDGALATGLTLSSAAGAHVATFAGSLTSVALTATGAVSLSPAGANVVLSPTGLGVVTIAPATLGTLNNVTIGGVTPAAGTFTAVAGTTWTGTGLIQTTLTTEQLRLRYDTSNYLSVTVGSTGNTTIGLSTVGSTLTIGGTGETLATFVDDGAVTLYFNNAARIATSTTGLSTTGVILNSGDGIRTTTGGSSTIIAESTGNAARIFADARADGASQAGFYLGRQGTTMVWGWEKNTEATYAQSMQIRVQDGTGATIDTPFYIVRAANGAITLGGNTGGGTLGARQVIIDGTGFGAGVASLRLNGLTSGAAAAAGTLLNAPAAGDPAFWIPISIAGTVRYVPAW
jgi:hypothetical protein